jgi:hypothetical protein
MFDPELEQFKTAIDLRAYAAAQGYLLDRKKSYRGSTVMRHPASNDKISIRLGVDGHYEWFSVRTNAGGTIIDFVRHLRGLNLGDIRKELRPWIGEPPVPVPAFRALRGTGKDRMKVTAIYARMKDASAGHPYLEGQRALPSSLLARERFAGRIRIDARGNAVFAHVDADGLCGYELKNSGFTGFASGATKGLFLSDERLDDKTLVFCESAIDALSYAVLFPDDHTRYASIGGKLNREQPGLIKSAISRMPQQARIVAAMDADEDGARLAEEVHKAFLLTGRQDLTFVRHEPQGFKDWNDELRAKPKPPLPYRPAEVVPG